MSVLVDSNIRNASKPSTNPYCPQLITPFNEDQLQPASYDVLLGDQLRHPGPEAPMSLAWFRTGYILTPGEFILGHTIETVHLSGAYLGQVNGKSSLGRLGLMVHVTAGLLDPGFRGQITLELLNVSKQPIELRSGMRIAQVSFQRLQWAPDRLYGDERLGSHYQGQTGATPAWMEARS